MSRVLSDLLGIDEHRLGKIISQLEGESHHPNIDVRLISEISSKVRHKLRELGLDPSDTTGQELYHMLQLLTAKHDEFLARAIGASDPADVNDVVPRVRTIISRLDIPNGCWALKHSVAKKLLKTMPPKRVMRQLGYKSVDSMLKRERITGLFAAARISESDAWQQRFIRSYKALKPGDFEDRELEVLLIKNPLWQEMAKEFVRKNRHNITNLKDMGAVVLLPMPVDNLPGVTITLLPTLLRSINELRSFSAYLKLEQVKPNFGLTLAKTLLDPASASLSVAGQRFPWRVIQQYLSGLKPAERPDIFGPHLQPEDLEWSNPEDILYRLEPALKFWQDYGYLAASHTEKPVSFNLLDNAISYCNHLPYGGQLVKHFRESLKSELYRRYLAETRLGQQTLSRLDDSLVGIKGELEGIVV